jgi:hypothetical protein
MNKVSVQALNECFNVSGEDFIWIDDDYEILSSPPPFPEEVKQAISAALKGNKNGKGNVGKARTEENKEKIRDAIKKLWESGSYKNKTNGHKKGKDNPWYGRRHTEETILKQQIVKCKYQYEVISPTGDMYITNNLKDFCRKNDLSGRWMYATVSGKAKHHKGWSARRLNG